MATQLGSFIGNQFYGATSGFVVVVEKPAPEPEPEPTPTPQSQELTVRSAPASVSNHSHVNDMPAAEFSPYTSSEAVLDRVAALLAEAVKLTQTLDHATQRRARELFHASSSLLVATTVLPATDQAKFQAALRNRK